MPLFARDNCSLAPVTKRYIPSPFQKKAGNVASPVSLTALLNGAGTTGDDIMTRNLAATLGLMAVAATAFAATPAMADGAWSRSGSGSGPYGRTWSSSGQCAGGSCSSYQQATGPNGNSWTRSGSSSCSGGTCSRSATVTSPSGRTVNRSASRNRY